MTRFRRAFAPAALRRLGNVAAVALLSTSAPASALEFDDLTPREQASVRDYVVGNVTWTLLHEMGHMLIGRLGLPVLGKEEDAADGLAAVIMLAAKTAKMDQALRNVAKNWTIGKSNMREVNDRTLADEHEVPRRRGFMTLCMMLGYDADKFAPTAEALGYPEGAPNDCYATARKAWGSLLVPHMRQDGASRVAISYSTAFGREDEAYGRVRGWLQDDRTVETVAGMVGRYFDFGDPITVSVDYCNADDPRDREAQNAFWMEGESKVLLCYELAVGLMDNAVAAVRKERQDADKEISSAQDGG